MKKLTNIGIDQINKTLSFTAQFDNDINDTDLIIFVDERSNMNNMYSDQSENHSYYFNKYNSEINITSLGNHKYDIEITHDVIEDMNDHMKYIKILSGEDNFIVEGVYYNPTAIFYAEINHLKRVCNMCLDDRTMKLVVLIVFKRQLLDAALETDDYNKCMVLYHDLCRLLEVSDDDGCCCEEVNVDSCPSCSGGCCCLK